MSASLDTITPLDAGLLAESENAPWTNLAPSPLAWRSPEDIISKMPLDQQLAHYKLAWEIMKLELEQARSEIATLKRAQEAKP